MWHSGKVQKLRDTQGMSKNYVTLLSLTQFCWNSQNNPLCDTSNNQTALMLRAGKISGSYANSRHSQWLLTWRQLKTEPERVPNRSNVFSQFIADPSPPHEILFRSIECVSHREAYKFEADNLRNPIFSLINFLLKIALHQQKSDDKELKEDSIDESLASHGNAKSETSSNLF